LSNEINEEKRNAEPTELDAKHAQTGQVAKKWKEKTTLKP